MSRQSIARLLCLSLLVGLLGGCGRKSGVVGLVDDSFGSVPEEDSQTETEPVAASGSFSMPFNESYGWNPYTCTSMENQAVMQLIYEGLFVLDNAFDAEPLLCREYSVSDDGLIYTLTLAEATFSTGASLTASDVVHSLDLAAESDLYGSRFQDIETYYTGDSGTVIIELSTPNDRLPCLLTFPIIPSGSRGESAPGTGPFVRNSTVLTKNTQWWQGASQVHFQTVTLFSSASAEDTRDNFEIDNVHFVYNDPSASSAATFHCDYELWNSRSTVMQYIGFNFNNGIFQDSSVRAAITHAIDRESIAESVYHNFADAASLPVAPSSSMYDETLAQEYSFVSVTKAQEELLETASFYLPAQTAEKEEEEEPEDTEDTEETEETEETEDEPEEEPEEETTYNNITMLVRDGNVSREAAARQVAQDLTDVGFTVELKVLSDAEFYVELVNDQWDLYYGEVTLKPDFDLRALLTYGGSLCYGGFSGSSTLDTLMERAMENSGNRYDLYECIMDQGYLCPVLFVNNAVFTTRGVFTGLDPSPSSLFYNISGISVEHN
jgi:peptide/nickel transport system substrate-binding protein